MRKHEGIVRKPVGCKALLLTDGSNASRKGSVWELPPSISARKSYVSASLLESFMSAARCAWLLSSGVVAVLPALL